MKKLFSTITLLLITASLFAQKESFLKQHVKVFTQLGVGYTQTKTSMGNFSVELQAGARFDKVFSSVGYIVLPDAGQPSLFNIRAGYIPIEHVVVYAGYVRSISSTDVKSVNYNTWQIGAQVNYVYFDRGTLYTSGTFTNKQGLSFHFGMTYNLFIKKE